jgi:putative transposase
MSTIQHTIQHTIQRAYQTGLTLNKAQITACKRHVGAARWAYNWGLARKQESYHATGTSPTAIDLHRELNVLKQTTVPWMYDVSKCAPQEALRNLDSAIAHFYRRCQLKRQGKLRGKVRYPQPKTKTRGWAASASPAASSSCPTLSCCPGLGLLAQVNLSPLKQEPNTFDASA